MQRRGYDGSNPTASVIDARGVLYGTTDFGSDYSGGTVFAFDLNTGTEQSLYSFDDNPEANVVDLKGTLYGTTSGGDDYDGGTVFSFDLGTGVEKTVHQFVTPDGVFPAAGLIKVGGTLYGTTQYGGAYVYGAVLSLDPTTGTENVVYSFCSQANCADGSVGSDRRSDQRERSTVRNDYQR